MPQYRILRSPDPDDGGATTVDDTVTLTRAEYDALQASLLVPDVGNVEELAAVAKADAWERAFKETLRERELATALAGRPLVPGGAEQLIKLWRDDFDVVEEGGEFKVSARDGKPVGQAVAERLSRPEYAHFCPPTSRGGTASGPLGRPLPTAAASASPRNLGERVIQQWRETAAARSEDPNAPIGLRRRL